MTDKTGTETRITGMAVIRRGLSLSPAITKGLWLTLLLSALGTAGMSIIPVVVQRAIDQGLGDEGVKPGALTEYVVIASLILIAASTFAYLAKVRLYVATENGLSEIRVKAFRHVHDLSMLTQNEQRRGSLVSRVTSDVDQISMFLQFTGMIMILSIGQMLIATIVMAALSWQLTVVVLLSFAPIMISLKWFAAAMSRAYDKVRATVGEMLGAISEPVVGASVVRAYGIEQRTQNRIDAAINTNYSANVKAQTITAFTFGSAGLSAGLANAGVLGVGLWLGIAGELSMGTLIAFVFLVGLFLGPAQMATQVLSDAQNAISSWRRVIELLDTPADVVDPGESGKNLPAGSLGIKFEHVSFAYPSGPLVLQDVDVQILPNQRVAIVGETGSGKTTFGKLLTRLMDPTTGTVMFTSDKDSIDISEVSFADLREHILMVPQEGFLFADTLAANIRYGKPEASDDEIIETITNLGLSDWLATLPNGLDTNVGQRGESLSAGERQLVALIRSALAEPAILVLDEATSAVDPQTELRTTRALERLLKGRTSVTIAHRLSTAENADRVLVFDNGKLVQQGTHEELVKDESGVYARLHRSWIAQSRLGAPPTI